MDPIYYYLFGATIVVFIILGWYLRKKGREELAQQQFQQAIQQQAAPAALKHATNPEMLRLQLQAYERLIILVERIGLQNLISKADAGQIAAVQFQQLLNQTIRSEFEYNVSQQLYVSTVAWDAVKNLKEQNIYIINQISSMLQPEATGLELSKKIAELLSADENSSLQNIVTALLQKEAKQLMLG